MSNARGFSYDDETGEVVFYNINDETGEPSMESNHPPAYTPPRHEGTSEPITTSPQERVISPPQEKYTKFPKGITTKSKKFQSLKANIMAGSNHVSHRMLLIPTVVMIFPGFICICLAALEVFLHLRCHKKNKHLTDSTLYYRSPFHAVSSTFCGMCRESELAWRVAQLQDQRKYRYDYLRGIAL
ncbi:uncharacterized protein LOC126380157 [Pectinophora gossypiella]|uniref:Uncharacterized protein n=1 Tax=Pectinophora gossypiella TaxID=13191 RepID=A0A1E1W797_PECGO|nr:uncharacterized protein LOC126380157 [Pectinophora gossypiella]XP_049885379.1 uncharacterized protein LOC126380157 [Pectinophora gossypiella]XP_049885380.1 uncharacterized protein LOC126380157 [Pectinophora gossypiella]